MRRLIIAGLLLYLAVGCQRDRPGKDLVPPDVLVPVIVDMHLAQAIQSTQDFRKLARQVDSLDVHGYIFEKHDITRVQFDSTVAWYSRHPELFREIYDRVVMQLTLISDSIRQVKD